MDKFIQRILACANIDDQDSIIQTFPIISAYYHNVEKRLLLYRFTNNGLPNYAVIGVFKDGFLIDRDRFFEWLKKLNQLILARPNAEKLTMLENFRESEYFLHLLYTQEGFDLINGKQYFTVGGLVSRTVLIPCHVCEDYSIEFSSKIEENEYNQFMNGPVFRDYEDYEKNYFLNYSEYHTMAYCSVLEYVEFNRKRLLNKEEKITQFMTDNKFLVQILDSYLAQDLFDDHLKRK